MNRFDVDLEEVPVDDHEGRRQSRRALPGEVVRAPSTRAAASSWGVVWVAVRRAVLNEHMASTYATAPRTAWRLAAEADGASHRPISIDAMLDAGWERPDTSRVVGTEVLALMVDLMVETGRAREQARDVMPAVAGPAPWGPGSGWRWIANRVDAEAWQVHQLIEALVREKPRSSSTRRMISRCARLVAHL